MQIFNGGNHVKKMLPCHTSSKFVAHENMGGTRIFNDITVIAVVTTRLRILDYNIYRSKDLARLAVAVQQPYL